MDTCFFSAWIGFPIACEGDVDGTLGCLIGKLLGCGVVYLSDWLEHDHSTLTLWHGGMAPTQVSEEPLFFMLGGHSTTTFSPNFDLLHPSSGQLWTFWIIPTKLGIYTDHLPTSSCSRSYWMPLALLRHAHMTFHLEQFYLLVYQEIHSGQGIEPDFLRLLLFQTGSKSFIWKIVLQNMHIDKEIFR